MKYIKMDSNENPIQHSVNLAKVAGEVNPRYYPDVTCSGIRKSLSELYNVPTEQILCTNGSDMLIKIITFMLVGNDEEIIIPEVAFPTYEIAANLKGCKYYLSPLKDYGIDLDDMLNHINADTKLIWVSNPHNPTGTLLSYDEILSFLDKVPEDVYVVLDEAYAEYVEGMLKYTFDFREKYKNLILLRTLSKAYGLAGARIGYTIAQEPIIEKLKGFIGPFDLNSYAQALGMEVLKDQEYLEIASKFNAKELEKYEDFFEDKDIEYIKSYANFIMFKADDKADLITDTLLKHNIKVKNGKLIGMTGWIRLSISLSEHNDKVREILKDII